MGYALDDVVRLLGLSTRQLRAFLKSGFLDPERDERGQLRFSFQDLVLLRSAKSLVEKKVPAARVRRALQALRKKLPAGRPLSSVHIAAVGDKLVVRDDGTQLEPESGQLLFDFSVKPLADKAAPLLRRAHKKAQSEDLSAEHWFELGCELEVSAPAEARDAYRRSVELEPGHVDAHVNLGRLLHDAGELGAAEAHYRLALAVRPDDVTAAFNLGVALEDGRRDAEAARIYQDVVRRDPGHADAHYNLAGVMERLGKKSAALQHLAIYRRLKG